MTEYIYATHIQPIVGLKVMALSPKKDQQRADITDINDR